MSEMIALADVFDAMRSRRVYSPPKPVDVIKGILLSERGRTFNPVLVDNLFEIISVEKHQAEAQCASLVQPVNLH